MLSVVNVSVCQSSSTLVNTTVTNTTEGKGGKGGGGDGEKHYLTNQSCAQCCPGVKISFLLGTQAVQKCAPQHNKTDI